MPRTGASTSTSLDSPSSEEGLATGNLAGEIPRIERRGLVRSASLRGLGLVFSLACLAVVTLLSLRYGAKPMTTSAVVDAVFAFDPTLDDHLIFRELRLPRTVLGLLVGVALGVSGAVMQGVARNPLADPGILGVSAGAALAVVVAISLLGISSLIGYVWWAFAGAAVASVFVYAVGSRGRDGASPVKLALAGAAIAAFLGSVTSAILVIDISTLDQFRFWAVGSIAGRDWEIVTQMAPFIALGVVMSLASGRLLNALALGDDVARSLGQRVGWARAFAAVCVVLLVGSATAAAGPIGFVGLTVPHVARVITGPDYRWVLPYSAVLAPILLLGADIIGRLVVRPGELQVGIVTALIGAPFFIALVRRRKLAEL